MTDKLHSAPALIVLGVLGLAGVYVGTSLEDRKLASAVGLEAGLAAIVDSLRLELRTATDDQRPALERTLAARRQALTNARYHVANGTAQWERRWRWTGSRMLVTEASIILVAMGLGWLMWRRNAMVKRDLEGSSERNAT